MEGSAVAASLGVPCFALALSEAKTELANVSGQPRHRSGVDGLPRRADSNVPGALRCAWRMAPSANPGPLRQVLCRRSDSPGAWQGQPRGAGRRRPGARRGAPVPPRRRAASPIQPTSCLRRARAELSVSKRGHSPMARCARERDRDLSATCTTAGTPSSPNLSAALWLGRCAHSRPTGFWKPHPSIDRRI